MSPFSCHLTVAAFLLFSLQQDATPPTPSVADAARGARQHKESSKPKHVWTDDDISPKAGYAAAGIKESEIRSQLQRDATVPQVPNATNLTNRIYDFSVASGTSGASESANYRQSILAGHEKTPFAGQKEWEEQMDTAVEHMHEELGPTATRLRAILDENKDALLRGDTATSQKVREQWIEALVPYTAWQMRVQQLWLDGEARVKANSSKPQAH